MVKRKRSNSTPSGGSRARRMLDWVPHVAPIVGQVLNQLKGSPPPYSPTTTSTKKKQTSGKKGSRQTSRSTGFVKKAKRKVQKKYNSGVQLTTERGGILNTKIAGEAGPTVVIGHGTVPAEQTLTLIFRTIAQELARRVGIDITDVDTARFGETNDVIRMYYFADRNLTTTILSHDITQLAVPRSVGTVGTAMMLWWQTLNEQAQLHSVDYLPISNQSPAPNASNYTRFQLPLLKARISMHVKSTLKMQNRTVEAEGDDDANDVDNVPLFGKVYEGSGNGMRSISKNGGMSFVADDNYGDIWKQDTRSTGVDHIREPPPPNMFTNVKKHSKLRIEPGGIKTSSLTYNRSMLLDTLLQILNQETVGNEVYIPMGTFRVMILEKMIQVGTFASDLGIRIGYEVNNYYRFAFHTSFMKTSIPIVRLGQVNETVR